MTRALALLAVAAVAACVLPADEVSAHPAWGIVVDRNEQVYFSDLETVWKIDARGGLTVFRAGVSGRHVHELALDDDGNLYGPDYSYVPASQSYINAVWKMTPAGAFSYVLAPTKDPPRGMSIWRDRDGNTYAVEQNNHLKRETLLVRRTQGGVVTVFAGGSYGHADGKGGDAKFSSVVGMAFGPDGALYLADGAYVRKVTTDGTVTTLAGGLDAPDAGQNPAGEAALWGGLMGLSVDARGDVYVADYRNRRVLKVTQGGAVSTAARSEQGWAPTGAAASRDGDLYFLEVGSAPSSANRPRVRRLSPDGRVALLAAVGEDGNRPAVESSPVGGPARNVEPARGVPYVLLGIGLSVCALTLFIRRARRRTSGRPHGGA